jgi:hypothetical protein
MDFTMRIDCKCMLLLSLLVAEFSVGFEYNTECPDLNDNKIERNASSTTKCIREIDILSNTRPHIVPYVISRYEYGRH